MKRIAQIVLIASILSYGYSEWIRYTQLKMYKEMPKYQIPLQQEVNLDTGSYFVWGIYLDSTHVNHAIDYEFKRKRQKITLTSKEVRDTTRIIKRPLVPIDDQFYTIIEWLTIIDSGTYYLTSTLNTNEISAIGIQNTDEHDGLEGAIEYLLIYYASIILGLISLIILTWGWLKKRFFNKRS